MQALVKGLQSGGASLGKVLPALGAAASARITTTAAAPANQTPESAVTTPLEREFQIYRWHPEEGGKPKYQSYQLDLNECAPKMPLNTSPALSSSCAPALLWLVHAAAPLAWQLCRTPSVDPTLQACCDRHA